MDLHSHTVDQGGNCLICETNWAGHCRSMKCVPEVRYLLGTWVGYPWHPLTPLGSFVIRALHSLSSGTAAPQMTTNRTGENNIEAEQNTRQ